MKILFTADHHICLRAKNVPRDWALNRYSLFTDKVSELEKTHDIHILGGDIFDRLPTLEELAVFFDWVYRFSIPTFIYSGNHESETKKKSFLSRLKHVVQQINKNVIIVDEISSGAELGYSDCDFYVVPYEYLKSKTTWEKINTQAVFTHVRGEIPPHVEPEIPLEWLTKYPVVFAGDLHSHKNTQANIVYPGSPMTTSFHREISKGSNGFLSIESSDWSWTWGDLGLPQLIRKTVSDRSEIVPTEFHHTIYELEGTMDEVAGKVDSDLLDKKIVRRSTEATLILNERMSLMDELVEYLDYVLQIEDTEKILKVYNEYSNSHQNEVE